MNIPDMMFANCRDRYLRRPDPDIMNENITFLASTIPDVTVIEDWPSTNGLLRFVPNANSSLRTERLYGQEMIRPSEPKPYGMTLMHTNTTITSDLYLRVQIQLPTFMTSPWNIRPYHVLTIFSGPAETLILTADPIYTVNSMSPAAWTFKVSWVNSTGWSQAMSVTQTVDLGTFQYAPPQEGYHDIRVFIPKSRQAYMIARKTITGTVVKETQAVSTHGYGFLDNTKDGSIVLNASTVNGTSNALVGYGRVGLGNNLK